MDNEGRHNKMKLTQMMTVCPRWFSPKNMPLKWLGSMVNVSHDYGNAPHVTRVDCMDDRTEGTFCAYIAVDDASHTAPL